MASENMSHDAQKTNRQYLRTIAVALSIPVLIQVLEIVLLTRRGVRPSTGVGWTMYLVSSLPGFAVIARAWGKTAWLFAPFYFAMVFGIFMIVSIEVGILMGGEGP